MTIIKQILKNKFDLRLLRTDNNYYVKFNDVMSTSFTSLEEANEAFDDIYEMTSLSQ